MKPERVGGYAPSDRIVLDRQQRRSQRAAGGEDFVNANTTIHLKRGFSFRSMSIPLSVNEQSFRGYLN